MMKNEQLVMTDVREPMFSKHVWHDRRHVAEVFINQDGVVTGTLVAYQGAVCLINPRAEILASLYHEAKLKRILSIKAVILTDNTIEYTRGLCSLVGYSRGLRRKSPLAVIARSESKLSTDFLNSCCARLLGDAAFDVAIVPVSSGDTHTLGGGVIRFESVADGEANPCLVIETADRSLQYFDETHRGASIALVATGGQQPVVIRAASLRATVIRTATNEEPVHARSRAVGQL